MQLSAKNLISIITESLWAFGISVFAGMNIGGSGVHPGASA
ncbi:hypothetical protein [Viridibacillus soli]|nr:hypothetical protein [Viridibacillus soli]